jgi:hypothetical protein
MKKTLILSFTFHILASLSGHASDVVKDELKQELFLDQNRLSQQLVQSGDSLTEIVQATYPSGTLRAFNKIVFALNPQLCDVDFIKPGEIVYLPDEKTKKKLVESAELRKSIREGYFKIKFLNQKIERDIAGEVLPLAEPELLEIKKQTENEKLEIQFKLSSAFVMLTSEKKINGAKLDLNSESALGFEFNTNWETSNWFIQMGYKFQSINIANTANNEIKNTNLNISQMKFSLQKEIFSWLRIASWIDFRETLFQRTISNKLDVYKGFSLTPRVGLVLTPIKGERLSVELGVALGTSSIISDQGENFEGGKLVDIWLNNQMKLKDNYRFNAGFGHQSERSQNNDYDQEYKSISFTLGLSKDF